MQSWLGTAVTAAAPESDDDDFLRSAHAARDLIAEAKVVIMERHGLDAGEAFELLRHYGRSMDRPLRDVAHKVVRGTWVADA